MPDKENKSCECSGNQLQVYILIEETFTFSPRAPNEPFKITKGSLKIAIAIPIMLYV